MKKIIFAVILGTLWLKSYAQQFEEKLRMPLPDSVMTGELTWVDLDNDSLLDVLIIAQAISGKSFLLTYKNDLAQGLIWQSSEQTQFIITSYLLADANDDNYIDVFLSGDLNGQPATGLYLSKDNFSFEFHPVTAIAGSVLKMGDLNNDGKQELMISGLSSGQPFFSIFRNNTNNWQLISDSLQINASAIEVFDFDNDGNKDLFVSGEAADQTIINKIWYLEKSGQESRSHAVTSSISGNSALGDVNQDGRFDILLAGMNDQGEFHLQALLNQGNSFIVKDSLPALQNQKIFTADLNSNGFSDMNMTGQTLTGDSLDLILNDAADYDSIEVQGLKVQRFGDFDRDGDLDLLQWIKTASTSELVVSDNITSAVNLPPGRPSSPFAAFVFNRFFLYWTKPADDHTPEPALTYDVTLQTVSGNLMAGEFDLFTEKRLTVSHGNNGNNNFLLMRSNTQGPVNFAFQAIDNSFHAGSSGICKGLVGVGEHCNKITFETVEVCKNELVTLTADAGALWFSFAKGLLLTAASYEFTAAEPDTIFSFSPQGEDCASLKAYAISTPQTLVRRTEETRYVCEGDNIRLGVESGWESVAWSSHLTGFLANTDSIIFKTNADDTVKVSISDGTGCQLERNTFLKISKPVVELNGEVFQILKGEGVQLVASGGEKYLWTPFTGLSRADIPDPFASPAVTTTYEIAVTDSVGCYAHAQVQVIVEGSAFVPTLFTPNADGKNDELRIYGLNSVKNFSFTIHNREGSIVFETKDVNEATSGGWNGTARGVVQPSGIYYWKIKGEVSSGRQLRLNGKSSGSIVLIR